MKTSRIVNAVGHIDGELISAAVNNRTNTNNTNNINKRGLWVRIGAAAACICVLCAAAIITVPKLLNENLSGAGGINGKINVNSEIKILGEEFAISDVEASEYLSKVKSGIENLLVLNGVSVSNIEITEKGYSHVRTGDDGNSIAVNWRDYLVYDGEKIVAIVPVTKDESGMTHHVMFGSPSYPYYSDMLEENKGEELVFIYIGDVDAFITPDNEIHTLIPLPESDNISIAIDESQQYKYYEFLKTPYNVYVP